MAKDKTKTDEKVPDKKLNRLLIEQKVGESLSDLKSLVSKKEFEQGIKKAAKQLTRNFSKKSLDNFRKQDKSIHPEKEIKDNITMLIEDLP
jgi:hypothetical protein